MIPMKDETESDDNGNVIIKGFSPALSDLLKHIPQYIPDEVDLCVIRLLYTILLNEFQHRKKEGKEMPVGITIYVPDIFKLFNRTSVSRDETVSLIKRILVYRNIIGILDENILPVLSYLGEDNDKKTITIAAPYLNRLIEKIEKESEEEKEKKGRSQKKNNPHPSYSYLIKPTIFNERNKTAVEIVHIVVTVIEETGSKGEPHISAQTIIERNEYLRKQFEGASSTQNKNNVLRRAYSKAWELLETQTNLSVAYKNIELPDKKKDIPTVSKMDMVFSFKHEGKRKDKER